MSSPDHKPATDNGQPICSRDRCDGTERVGGLCEKHRKAHIRAHHPNGYYVPAAQVAVHIVALRDAGMTWEWIAAAANHQIGTRGIRSIVGRAGPSSRHGDTVVSTTAAAVLAIPMPTFETILATGRPGANVSGVGTARRLRALIAMGYTNVQLSEEIGYPLTQIHRLIHGRASGVTIRVHKRVAVAFARLESIPPPPGMAADRSRRRAERFGWDLPFAWDEDTLDDPAATGHTGVVVGIGQRPGPQRNLPMDEFMAIVEDWTDRGHTLDEIADHLGITVDGVQARIRRKLVADAERAAAAALEVAS